MAKEIAVADKRSADAEYTRQENKKYFLEDEIRTLEETKAALEAEIAKKSSDYTIYLAQRDGVSKALHQETLAERAKLDQEMAEFKSIVEKFQAEKAAFTEEKAASVNQKARYEAQMNNVRQFITAVQRAGSLLAL